MNKLLLSGFLLLAVAVRGANLPVVDTINNLANRGAIAPTEAAMVLGTDTNRYFAQPLIYKYRPTLSTNLHNPPAYIKGKTGALGVWEADFVNSGVIYGEWFGVVADGVTDNLASIRSAISFINSRGGGTLILPPGEVGVDVIHTAPFVNSRTIELCSNLKLQLDKSTTLKVLGTWSVGQYYAIISTLPSGLYGNITNATIEGNGGLLLGKRTETANDADVVHGLLFNATGANGIVVRNLRINNCHSGAQINAVNVLFEDVHVTNAENNAFAITEATDVTFYRCSGTYTRATPGGNCVQAGVDVEPDVGETVTNVRFVDCVFANNGKYGLKLQQGAGTATKFFVVNSVISGNTNVGVQIDGGSDVFISQNNLFGNALTNIANNAQILVAANRFNISDNIVVGTPYGYGLRIAATTVSQDWVVQGNRFTDCGGLFAQSANNASVQIASATAGVFANNIIHGGGEYGILLSASDGLVFTGNTVARFNREALLMLTEAQNISFEGNTFAEVYLSGGGQYVSLASGYEVANISFRDNRFSQALKYNNGVVSAYSAGTPSITLAITAAAQDNWYTNYYALVGAERIRITGYVGSTRVATLASAFASAPTPGTSTYQIVGAASPNIGIYSQDADNDQIVCINNDFLTSGSGAPYLGDAADMFITWAQGKAVAVTNTYTATLDDEILYIDATAGAITINLPSTTSGRANNKHYTFYRTDSTANSVVIDPNGGQLIDNAVTVPMGRGPEAFTIIGRSDASWKTVATYETKAAIDGFPYVKLDDEWLRLVAGTNITVATNVSGQVVITGTASSGIADATADSTPYSRYNNSWRRIVAGANITIVTNGSGEISIASSGGGGGGPTNGTALYVDGTFGTAFNAINSSEIDPSVSGTNLTWSIIANSLGTNTVSSGFRSFFLDRANHTGTQTASTISDFANTVWAKLTNALTASNNITFVYDTSLQKLLISSTGGGGGGGTNGVGIYINGDTANIVSNLVNGTSGEFQRTAGTATFVVTNVTDASIPAGIARDSEVASTYVSLAGNNTITGGNVFSGVIQFLGSLSASNVVATNLYVGSTNVAAKLTQLDSDVANAKVFVNGIQKTPAYFTNGPSTLWTTNANGHIVMTVTNVSGGTATYTTNKADVPIFISTDNVVVSAATTNEVTIVGTLMSGQSKQLDADVLTSGRVLRIRASGTFDPSSSDWSGAYMRVKYGGRVLTARFAEMNSTTPNDGVWWLDTYMAVNAAGSNASNTVVGVFMHQESDPIANSGGNIVNMEPSGTLNTTVTNTLDVTFQNDPSQTLDFVCSHVEAYYMADPLVTGGSGLVFADGVLVANPNIVSTSDITNVVTSSTNITPTLTDTGVTAGTYNNATVTVDTKGRVTAANPWLFYREYEFLTPSSSRATAMAPDAAGTAISSGSANQLNPPIADRPGVMRLTSSGSVNSGYGYLSDVTSLVFGGGEEAEIGFRIPTTNFTTVTFGFFDTSTASIPTDGLVARVGASGTTFGFVEGFAYSNTVPSVSPSSYQLAENTFYRLAVSNSVPYGTFTTMLKDTNNSVLWSSQVTNGFPVGTTRSFGFGFTAWNTNNVSTNVLDVDYAWFGIRRTATR